MKDKSKKTKTIMLRMTSSMYEALVRVSEKRDCSIPEVIRHATKKFYRIGYQK